MLNSVLASNNSNFVPGAPGEPSLISLDDAETLFHEFGHALHQMLSDVTHESISGTSVARDFVELPSQLYEHWLAVPSVLAEFATHAETGAAMPGGGGAALRGRDGARPLRWHRLLYCAAAGARGRGALGGMACLFVRMHVAA